MDNSKLVQYTQPAARKHRITILIPFQKASSDMNSSPVLAIHHASLLVSDTEKSLAFYCGILGLAVDLSRPEMAFPGAWLTINDCQQIHLLELPNPDPINGRPAHGGRDRHVALHVVDIDAIATQLDAEGVQYTRSASGRQALFCRDPDGNAIELFPPVSC